MTLNLSLLLGGAGNPVAETYKTIQEPRKDANLRSIRFNTYKPDKCNISSKTTDISFEIDEMREHSVVCMNLIVFY